MFDFIFDYRLWPHFNYSLLIKFRLVTSIENFIRTLFKTCYRKIQTSELMLFIFVLFLLNLSIIILCSCLILWCLSFIFKLLLVLIIWLWFLICIVLTNLLFDYRLIELLRLLRLNSFIFLLFCCFILITLLLCLLILLPLFIIRCLKIFLKLLLMILLWTLKFFRLTIWFNIWILTHIYCIWDSIQCSLFLFWLLLINFLLVSLNFCFKFL